MLGRLWRWEGGRGSGFAWLLPLHAMPIDPVTLELWETRSGSVERGLPAGNGGGISVKF